MAALEFGKIENKTGEAGVSHGVIYRLGTGGKYDEAEVWDGLTAVNTAPEGGDAQDFYADNAKYLTLRAAENFKGTIEAYRFPEKFAECDGTKMLDGALTGAWASGQDRVPFCLSWETQLVNATLGTGYGTKIHIAYLCTASPSSQDNATLNDSPEIKQFSWEFSGTPVPVPGMKPSAYLSFDSTKMVDAKWKKLTEILHGAASTKAECMMPTELVAALKAAN